MSRRIYNFSAGPAVLPVAVLKRVREELLSFEETGMSVMEMSHRSKEFGRIRDRTEAAIRRVLTIPDDYAVLFLQGGASLQFTMVPQNLYLQGNPVDVLHTGAWTKKAMAELTKVAAYDIAASTEAGNFTRLPWPEEMIFNENASYVYLCSNNTIFGTQWHTFPDTGEIPLVADMSSDIASREINISKFGLIFAGAQKNMGPAGVTIVIIQPELAERAPKDRPTMLQYRTHIASNSLYNTPPTFAIYVVGLMMEWIESEGGLPAIQARNEEKAGMLYNAIDESPFYYCPIATQDRSRMNVVYRICGENEDVEKKFVEEATKAGLSGLKGHRSVGGLRASLYNAQTLEAVNALVDFMRKFEKKYG